MAMEKHFKVAYAHFALGCIAALSFATATMISLSGFVESDFKSFVATWMVVTGIWTCLHFWVYRGAKLRSRGARKASNWIGFILLFAFPIGTAFGAFILWNSWLYEDEEEKPEESTPTNTP